MVAILKDASKYVQLSRIEEFDSTSSIQDKIRTCLGVLKVRFCLLTFLIWLDSLFLFVPVSMAYPKVKRLESNWEFFFPWFALLKMVRLQWITTDSFGSVQFVLYQRLFWILWFYTEYSSTDKFK